MRRNCSRLLITLGVCLNFCAVFPVQAAETGSEDGKINTFAEILQAGGWPIYVIIALSALAMFLVLFFLFTFRNSVIAPKRFLNEVDDAANDGDIDAMQAACETSQSAASKVIAAAAEHMKASGQFDYTAVRDAVEDEGSRQANILWQRLQYLMDIAVISPMVGLLGTVLGMLDSFAGMETELGAVKPVTVSQGVSKALITTAGGLMVGIAAMILYALFRGQVNKLVTTIEESCSDILRKAVENVKQ